MYRVFTHERIGRFDREFLVAALVIGVHEIQLDLARDVTERVARLYDLEDLDAAPVIARIDGLGGLFVGILQVLDRVIGLFVAGTGGQGRECGEQQAEAGPPPQAVHDARQVGERVHGWRGSNQIGEYTVNCSCNDDGRQSPNT